MYTVVDGTVGDDNNLATGDEYKSKELYSFLPDRYCLARYNTRALNKISDGTSRGHVRGGTLIMEVQVQNHTVLY